MNENCGGRGKKARNFGRSGGGGSDQILDAPTKILNTHHRPTHHTPQHHNTHHTHTPHHTTPHRHTPQHNNNDTPHNINWPKRKLFKKFWATKNWPKSNWSKSNWPKSNWPKSKKPKSNWPKSSILAGGAHVGQRSSCVEGNESCVEASRGHRAWSRCTMWLPCGGQYLHRGRGARTRL